MDHLGQRLPSFQIWNVCDVVRGTGVEFSTGTIVGLWQGASTDCPADQSCPCSLLWLLSGFIPGLVQLPQCEMLDTLIGYTYTNFMVLLHFYKSVRFSCIHVYCLLVISFCSHAAWKIRPLLITLFIQIISKCDVPILLVTRVIIEGDYFYTFILQWYKLWLVCTVLVIALSYMEKIIGV